MIDPVRQVFWTTTAIGLIAFWCWVGVSIVHLFH
jgi:hypothetical protein